jgi:hypothetical protein
MSRKRKKKKKKIEEDRRRRRRRGRGRWKNPRRNPRRRWRRELGDSTWGGAQQAAQSVLLKKWAIEHEQVARGQIA